MPIQALSATDLRKLEEGLKKLGTPPAAAAAVQIAGIEEEFCAIWPKAKPILQLIAKYIPIIPGVGSTAAAIINGLIDGLDLLSKAVCPTG